MDNTTLNTGAGGDVIATDDIAGIKHQRVKIEIGADGSASDVHAGNPLPVGDAGGSLTVDGTVTANVGTTGGLALDATLTGGTAKAIARGATKGVTAAADATVSSVDADHNAVDVFVRGSAAAGATEYTEDVASVADPIGGQLMARRRDALATETTTDGDVTALNSTGKGELYVKHADAIPVTDNAGSLTVDGTVTANAGTGTFRTEGGAAHDATVAGNPNLTGGRSSAAAPADVSADGEAVSAWHLRNGAQASVLTAAGALIGGDATNGLDVDVTRLPALVAGTANIGDVDVLTVPAPLSTTGGGTEATALRVTIANDSTGLVSVDDNGASLTVDGTVTANAGTGTFATKETRSPTSALTIVADNAASVLILASNANRLGASITNDSSARLYLRMEAAVASTANYAVSLAQFGYFEVPFGFTGEIRGIWSSDPGDGAARVTEYT